MESTAPAPRGSAATVADPCPQCDGEEVVTRWVDDVMTWGSGDLKSRIPVYVPVRTCAACDLQYIDQHGERLRHEAICRHLGVLSPADIRSIRRGYGMTRAAFAHFTGLGEGNHWAMGERSRHPESRQRPLPEASRDASCDYGHSSAGRRLPRNPADKMLQPVFIET